MPRNKDFPDIETAAELLSQACERLPEEIFRELNGGVNLLPEQRRSADGLVTLGLYHHNAMGRYIELFYGSFRAVYPDADANLLAQKLDETLRHELTHHLESLAGDRSLERWDEQHRAMLLRGTYDDDTATTAFLGGGYTRPEAALRRRRRAGTSPEEEL